MKIRKGERCVTTCCNREYNANFDFEPSRLVTIKNGKFYLSGKCFLCLFETEIAPELAKHGIIVETPLRR